VKTGKPNLDSFIFSSVAKPGTNGLFKCVMISITPATCLASAVLIAVIVPAVTGATAYAA